MSERESARRRGVRFVDQYARSARLMTDMAATQGIDLSAEVAHDDVHIATLICAVTRCAECTGQEECALWLAGQAGRRSEATPEYCVNSELLARLRPHAEDNKGETE